MNNITREPIGQNSAVTIRLTLSNVWGLLTVTCTAAGLLMYGTYFYDEQVKGRIDLVLSEQSRHHTETSAALAGIGLRIDQMEQKESVDVKDLNDKFYNYIYRERSKP